LFFSFGFCCWSTCQAWKQNVVGYIMCPVGNKYVVVVIYFFWVIFSLFLSAFTGQWWLLPGWWWNKHSKSLVLAPLARNAMPKNLK
jgi:hypothetical protein